MTSEKLKDAFAAAAKIAGTLPKNLQEAGFNRALDEILGATRGDSSRLARNAARTRRRPSGASSTGQEETTLLDLIDRTKYPDVGATDRVADQALKVLQIAKDDHGVDGLSASQIAAILTEKFRLPATRQGIGQALSRETRTINVKTSDGKRVFQLMAPGEAYLSRLRSVESEDGASRSRSRRKVTVGKKRTKRKGATKKATKKASKKKTSSKKTSVRASGRNRSGRPGPKAAIAQLVSAGFFGKKRRISDVQAELQHGRGHTYTIQALSPALVRSVRDRTLRRTRDESGQYEYSTA